MEVFRMQLVVRGYQGIWLDPLLNRFSINSLNGGELGSVVLPNYVDTQNLEFNVVDDILTVIGYYRMNQ
ncbi:unnamed protein product [Meloidogyne enterolobii]|uniref:Uncharacterized protein n=3 Tax=Meloidogyne enterolobii TaxID=390850 RepID=A0ACB0YE46_MELEN|nr:unnamed protein product [Meloidogyne enterolobii]